MNPQGLLDQFLGSQAGGRVDEALRTAGGKASSGGMGGMAGGLAAGGLIGVLLGNKKARKKVGKLAGGAVGYGGAAVVGALAYRAYENWRAGQRTAPPAVAGPGADEQVAPPPAPPAGSRFLPESAPASDGRPFELALVLAMIAAANADGHIGADEQRLIFERAGELPLDAEDKAFVFDALGKPPGLSDIAGLAGGQEQAAELYLASRLVADPDDPAEGAYLQALAHRLSLPAELVANLDAEVAAAAA
ncbi:MAG: tellurite resistance TerB family protein [Azospirillaceae bacterium]